jgi:hypothetical protein
MPEWEYSVAVTYDPASLKKIEAVPKSQDETAQQITGTPSGSKPFIELLEEIKQLHLKKSADYGAGEDPFANCRASEEIDIPGWLGTWIRARDKVHRIDQFAKRGELANESVEDSLMDLASYALIALVLFRESQG